MWPAGVVEIKNNLASQIPMWTDIKVADKGTYLGFVIGPGKKEESWVKPLAKYRDRVQRWSKIGGGMQYNTMAYNVFALSTLLYIAQLENIPEFVAKAERTAVLSMYKGPGNWISPEDVWFLKENYGLAKSSQPLDLVAKAAKLRVATFGCHFGVKHIQAKHLRRLGCDNIFSRARSLQTAINATEHIDRLNHWHDWYKQNMCKVIVDNIYWCKNKGIHCKDILAAINSDPIRDWGQEDITKAKNSFQKLVVQHIKQRELPNAIERIRSRTARWRGIPFGLSGLPGIICRRMHKRLHLLGTLVPPRVQAAVFTTLWNGWCTHRRFQRRGWPTNKCLFKCSVAAEDSIEHYCRCPVVLRVSEKLLHISYPPELGLDIWALSSGCFHDIDKLRTIALLIYGAFNAFNSIRYKGISCEEQAYQAIVQHIKQGTSGHAECTRHLDSRWLVQTSHIL